MIHAAVTQQHIVQVVCDYTGIPLERLQKKNRKREIVDTKKLISFFLRKLTPLSFNSIAEIFDMEHTSIISYMAQMEGHLENDAKMIRDYENIKTLLN